MLRRSQRNAILDRFKSKLWVLLGTNHLSVQPLSAVLHQRCCVIQPSGCECARPEGPSYPGSRP